MRNYNNEIDALTRRVETIEIRMKALATKLSLISDKLNRPAKDRGIEIWSKKR